jgi:hypothetical protein
VLAAGKHLAEAAPAQNAENIKVLKRNLQRLRINHQKKLVDLLVEFKVLELAVPNVKSTVRA